MRSANRMFVLSAVALVCMTAFAGACFISDDSEASSGTQTFVFIRGHNYQYSSFMADGTVSRTSGSVAPGITVSMSDYGDEYVEYDVVGTPTQNGTWTSVWSNSWETITLVIKVVDYIPVTFLKNDGSTGSSNVYATVNASTVPQYMDSYVRFTFPNAPARDGYAFKGWSTNASASSGSAAGTNGDIYMRSDNTAGVTYYAIWESVPFSVSYDAHGGTPSPSSVSVNHGASTTLPSVTKSGYTLAGWYTAASGGSRAGGAGDQYTPSANVTLHAQWSQNTVSGSANNMAGISGHSYTNQVSVTANNNATFTYAVKSCSAGTASVNSNGLVTFNAPSVNVTTDCNVVVTVTAHYPDGQTKAVDVAFSVMVDPVLTFTNSATNGSLSIKGA